MNDSMSMTLFDREPEYSDRNPVLVLIDGFALIYRSYFAFANKSFMSSSGEDTGALYAFSSTIMKVLREFEPNYIAVALDSSAPTFRHEIYPAYKATRAKMPESLREQLPRLKELIEAFGFAVFEKEGFEADDIIGTLSRLVEENKAWDVLILTGDKDFFQLVDDRIKIIKPSGRTGDFVLMDREKVLSKMGVPPEKVIDFLALTGDTSDNIPGVRGIGPRTASALISDFGSVDRILANPDNIRNETVRKKIKEYEEELVLSKELVTIKRDIPLDPDFERLRIPSAFPEKLKKMFLELEFSTLLMDAKTETTGKWWNSHIVDTEEGLRKLVSSMNGITLLAVDTETTSRYPMEAELVGISLAWKRSDAYYIPVGHKQGKNISIDTVRKILGPVMNNPAIGKVGQNIKYDIIVLNNAGFSLDGVKYDTMIASYLLDPGARNHGIDTLSMKYCNYKKIPTSELIGKGRRQITMDLLDTAKVGEYASEDAAVTLELMDRINPLIEETGLSDLLEAMEIPLIGVLARMEMNGIKIDRKLLSKLSADFGEKLDSLAERIQEMAGIKFNINSPKQLSYVLFDKMGIKPVRRTKTGFSTDEAVLVKLAESGVEMVSILLEYRKLSKLRSTYIDALPKMINVKTGRIHSSFNQTITSTGRLSSSDPNLQNIPVRTPEGRMIRKAFIVEADNAYILSADYSQIELRLMAHISGDESMIEAFMNDEDIHRATAARLFGITPEDVGDDERRRAKTVNFGVMYGMGEYGLAKRLGISVREAAGFIEEYFCKYPGIKDYINRTIKEAGEKGFTTTLLGRKRFLREINSSRKQVREAAERAAINMPIQGTAADLIKLAMLSIDEILLNEKYSTKMLLQVHDELVFEVPGSELDRIREMVQRVMSSVYPLKVPLKVDLGWGKNWLEAH